MNSPGSMPNTAALETNTGTDFLRSVPREDEMKTTDEEIQNETDTEIVGAYAAAYSNETRPTRRKSIRDGLVTSGFGGLKPELKRRILNEFARIDAEHGGA